MRKWLFLGLAIIAVALIAFLGQPAIDPEDFTGDWYSVDGQHVYRFRNGIIHCEQHFVELGDGSSFSGAYSFSGKSIQLFAIGVDGLESQKELYLVEHKEESLLSDRPDGKGAIYFVRHNEQ